MSMPTKPAMQIQKNTPRDRTQELLVSCCCELRPPPTDQKGRATTLYLLQSPSYPNTLGVDKTMQAIFSVLLLSDLVI